MAFDTSIKFDFYKKRTDRGEVVKAPTPFDPSACASLHVMCKKHPYTWIAVDAFGMNTAKSVSDLIDEAFDRCIHCIDEKQWTETRFPENAEL